MKPSERPEVEAGESDELDAGWGEAEVPSVALPAGAQAVALRSVPASAPAPVDDIDEAWGDDDDDDDEPSAVDARVPHERGDAREPYVAAAKSAHDHRKPTPRVISEVSRRALSKKERRELERKNRGHASKASSERKHSRRQSRREDAQRLAVQREEERAQAVAAAKKQKKQERRQLEHRRAKRAAEAEREEPRESKAGTERSGGKKSKHRGRLKKQTGGGWIVAVIALITLGTAIFAWSRR